MPQAWPQLRWLSTPFRQGLVETVQKGRRKVDYVNHAIVSQRLLALGPYSFRVLREVRGHAPAVHDAETGEVRWPALDDAVTGCVAQLTMTVDGRTVVVEDYGSCENAAMEDCDGERGKKAASDALKRCARHVGVGLSMWSKGVWILTGVLEALERVTGTDDGQPDLEDHEADATVDPDAPDPE